MEKEETLAASCHLLSTFVSNYTKQRCKENCGVGKAEGGGTGFKKYTKILQAEAEREHFKAKSSIHIHITNILRVLVVFYYDDDSSIKQKN